MRGQGGGGRGGSHRDLRISNGKPKDYEPEHRGKQKLHHSRGDRGNYELPPSYMLPDHPSDLNQSGRAIKERDFLGNVALVPPLPAAALEAQSLMPQKSMFLEDAPARAFYPLPLDGHFTDPPGEHNLSSRRNTRAGMIHDGDVPPHYHGHMRDHYGERDRERLYSREVLYPDVPPTQLRPIAGASSSMHAKDEHYAMHIHSDHLHQLTNGFAQGGHGRFLDEPLGHGGHGEMQISETMRWLPPAQMVPRGEPAEYGMHELSRRSREDERFPASEDMYDNVSWGSRANIRDPAGSSSFGSFPDNRVDRVRFSRKMANKSSFYDLHRSLRGDLAPRYCEMEGVHGDYECSSGSGGHLGFSERPLHQHEVASFQESHGLGGDDSPMVYRERSEGPVYLDHDMGAYRDDISSPGREYFDYVDTYDLTPERMAGREYVTVDDANGFDARNMISDHHDGFHARNMMLDDRNVFRRIALPGGADEEWPGEDRGNHLHSKRLAYGRSKFKMASHKQPRPTAWLPRGDSSMHERGGQTKSVKKRLRPAPPQFHGSYASERNEFHRAHKFWKRTVDDKHDGSDANYRDAPEDENLSMKKDPPEGSEEFKQQVLQAFLKFSKMLNDSPNKQKRYREPGKGPLLCFVCGSHSKKFLDTHSLVTHTYHTCKVGLKTKHLGLHKALCLLMGWNWLVAPDTSKSYQSSPSMEANALKEDLILWPPLVIIHNSSIGNNVTSGGAKIMTVEDIEGVLREIRPGAGKLNVIFGRPANQSVFLVKFSGTFSGLLEANKIHKHFADRNCGKEEFQRIKGGKARTDAPVEQQVDELLYGHIAVAEDLIYLDEETKKRRVVRSKKEIEAIVDSPL